MSPHYQIGEFAKFCGVSTKTLRFYDEIGVMRPASVDPRTGYRHYLPQQLEEMAPLSQLREFITKRGASADRRAILTTLKERVEHSIQTATQSLNWINAALDELDKDQSPIPVIVKRRPAVRVTSLCVELTRYAEVASWVHCRRNAWVLCAEFCGIAAPIRDRRKPSLSSN